LVQEPVQLELGDQGLGVGFCVAHPGEGLRKKEAGREIDVWRSYGREIKQVVW
jgi:hypothetical protein